MNRAAEMRSPAPLANAGNRAEVACNEAPFTIAQHKSEAPSTAICLGRRCGLALPLAQATAALSVTHWDPFRTSMLGA